MIQLKTPAEIEIMKQGGKILKDVLRLILQQVKAGVPLKSLDKFAEEQIIARGGQPSFKKVEGYHWTICGCVNEVVVHGIPSAYVLRACDAVGIDCGVYYKGFHTDAAWTVRVKDENTIQDNVDKFIETGKIALDRAIKQVQSGNYIYDISAAIESTIIRAGYCVVRTLTGHGVGRKLHENPEVPGFVHGIRENTPKIVPGMTLAIEVIYNMGGPEVVYRGDDAWTIVTKDGKISGLFEATVAATTHGCIVLT
jgi:methionyl aminopeptidase